MEKKDIFLGNDADEDESRHYHVGKRVTEIDFFSNAGTDPTVSPPTNDEHMEDVKQTDLCLGLANAPSDASTLDDGPDSGREAAETELAIAKVNKCADHLQQTELCLGLANAPSDASTLDDGPDSGRKAAETELAIAKVNKCADLRMMRLMLERVEAECASIKQQLAAFLDDPANANDVPVTIVAPNPTVVGDEMDVPMKEGENTTKNERTIGFAKAKSTATTAGVQEGQSDLPSERNNSHPVEDLKPQNKRRKNNQHEEGEPTKESIIKLKGLPAKTRGKKRVGKKSSGDESGEVNSPTKKVRVAVRTKLDTPMIDACHWRKYGEKKAKVNPMPRAYYHCTMDPDCPVKKHVQRCSNDLTVLVTTYEGDHNHVLPQAAMAMVAATTAAATALLSGPTASASAIINTAPLMAQAQLPFSSHLATISTSMPFPTITLDLTKPADETLATSPSPQPFNRLTLSSSVERPVTPILMIGNGDDDKGKEVKEED